MIETCLSQACSSQVSNCSSMSAPYMVGLSPLVPSLPCCTCISLEIPVFHRRYSHALLKPTVYNFTPLGDSEPLVLRLSVKYMKSQT